MTSSECGRLCLEAGRTRPPPEFEAERAGQGFSCTCDRQGRCRRLVAPDARRKGARGPVEAVNFAVPLQAPTRGDLRFAVGARRTHKGQAENGGERAHRTTDDTPRVRAAANHGAARDVWDRERVALRRAPARLLRRPRGAGRRRAVPGRRPARPDVLPASGFARSRALQLFGGVSPINGQNRALIGTLARRTSPRRSGLPVYWGNRNWHPLPRRHAARRWPRDGVAGRLPS